MKAARDALTALSVIVGAVVLTGEWTERATFDGMMETAQGRLDLYESTLQAGIDRYVYLPYVLAASDLVRRALQAPDDRAALRQANEYLEGLNREAGSSVLYVMDRDGLTRVSSDWQADLSSIGENNAFRPYFQDAIAGHLGRFYAIGSTTGEAGYFLAAPVYSGSALIGVAAVRFRPDDVERSWRRGPVKVAVTDANGIVFLSSEPRWKYQDFAALMQVRERAVREDAGDRHGVRRVLVPSAEGSSEHLAIERMIPPLGWRLTVMIGLAESNAIRRNAQAAAGSAAAFIFLLYLYMRQRRRRIRENLAAKAALERAYGELEHRVAERTADLVAANEELRSMHEELLRTGSLAALGQMAASITHELNQPLAALRTLSDNARVLLERDRLSEAAENLRTIAELTARLGRMTGQLKAFARKRSERLATVRLQTAVASALELVRPRAVAEDAQVVADLPAEPLDVRCDDASLAQILSNLLHNALDAVKEGPVRRVVVSASARGGQVLFSVTDSGPGIPKGVLPRVFEPFFTTKEAGLGMGLGLAICAGIARECGGTISASTREQEGAELVVQLPRATEAPA